MASSTLIFDLLAKDNASATFAKVAAAAQGTKAAMSDLGSSSGGLAKLVLPTALIPTLAVAGGQTMSLTTALLSAAGAGGILSLAVGGQVVEMVKQRLAIAKASEKLAGMTRGTQEYRDALIDLRNKQRAFNQEFGPAAKGFDAMKDAWGNFLAGTRKSTLPVVGKALGLIAVILPKLVPVANAAARAMSGLLDDLTRWVKGSGFQKFLDWLATSGAQNLTAFGHTIGNTAQGLGRFFGLFAKQGDQTASSLERLTASFAKWAGSAKTKSSVERFLEYMNDNGPTVSGILSSLAGILPKLATSFSGIGSITLTGVSDFLKLLASLPVPVFHAIADSILAIAVGQRAYAAATALATAATTSFTVAQGIAKGQTATFLGVKALEAGAWARSAAAAVASTAATVASTVAGKAAAVASKAWAAAQWVLNAALNANPIGIVVVAIAGLVAGLVIAYKKSETFRNICQKAFQAVAAAGRWMWNNVLQPVFKFLVDAIAFVMRMWAKMLGALGHVPGFGWAKEASKVMFDAAQKASNLGDKIKKIPNHANVTIVDNTAAKIAATQKYIDMLRQLNGTVARTYIQQIKTHGPVAGGGHPVAPRNAGGTPYFPGGVTTVGEHGPEQVILPRGSRIIANEAASNSGGSLGTLTVVIASDDGRVLERKLARLKRDRGGLRLAFES